MHSTQITHLSNRLRRLQVDSLSSTTLIPLSLAVFSAESESLLARWRTGEFTSDSELRWAKWKETGDYSLKNSNVGIIEGNSSL